MSLSTLYFGGSGSDLSKVRALRHASFQELVQQTLNIATSLNITRAEFAAMDKPRRDKAKRSTYLVPCTFEESEARRLTENAQECNLLFLDIDDSQAAMPYFNAPETLVEQLMPFDFACYTTASSTPTAPRLRVVVSAEGIPLTAYKSAVRKVARMIGLSEISRESLVPVQPMYLPVIFKEDSEDLHPLLAYSLDGRAMTMRDVGRAIENEDPPDGNKKAPGKDYTSGDALDYLRPNVPEVTLEMTEEALEHLDPDMGYAEWLDIAAAMRHQFYGTDNAEKAYKVFDDWSAKGSKYAGAKDTLAKWQSLRPNPVNRVPITIRSLLMSATQAGWSNTLVKDRIFQGVVRWMVDPERTASQLLSEGLGRILAAPLLSQAEEESLLHQIADQCRKRFGMKVGLSAMRRDMAELRMEMKASAANKKKKTKVPAWAKGLCYVGSVNKFYRQSTRERFDPQALNIYYSRKLLPTEEELKEQGAQANAVKPVMPPVEFLMNSVQIPTVYDYVYDPRFPKDTFLHQDGKPFVNLYVPNHPEPDKSQAAYAGKMFMKHLRHLIAEEEYRQTIMDFLAHIVQFPGKKVRWAILIQGVEGCGKTFIAKAMDAVLGKGHVRNVDASALNGQWNDWAYGAQMVVLEEVRVVGHSRHDIMNVLKPLISNDFININQRHRDSRQADNTVNYLLFTNHHDSIVVTHGDRRYFVLKSAMQTKEDLERFAPDYFTDLFNMLGTHAAGLRAFLEDWIISDSFQPSGHAPRTKYLYELLNDTASENTQAIRESIEENPHALIHRDIVSIQSLLLHLEMSGQYNVRNLTHPAMATILREEGYRKMGRFQILGDRHTLWIRAGSPLMACKDLPAECVRLLEARASTHPGEWEMLD